MVKGTVTRKPDGHFFDTDTEVLWRGTGDESIKSGNDNRLIGDEHECYVVSATRTKDWNGPCKPYIHYHYFDIDTLRDVSVS